MRGRDRATVRVDGRILPPDLLNRVSGNDTGLGGLRREDYHLSGETISEATSRSWNRLLGSWTAFKERRENLLEGEPETSMTRERWLLPLFRELDYGRLQTASAVEIGGRTYPVSHAWESTPIHLVGFRAELDTRTSGRAGAARMSPHSLVQELLNRSDDHLWAFVSNGLRLRILRDNASITRQSYVEFDLEAMMEGEVYPDFVLLWMLCHQSRVETGEGERPEECWLEKWSQAAQEQGSRALDRLRDGVQDAIQKLGSGFLSHRENAGLREKLRDGELHVQDYYRQLLRLVYRMLFLFVAEDRDHLLDPDASPEARERYTRFYGTRKLRLHAEKRVGGRHPDLYRQLAFVIKVLGDDDGCPPLGLPALGGFLFDEGAAPDLAAADLANRDLLDAVRALAFVDAGAGLTPVDFEHLGAEELGSVYESLLELAPVLEADSGDFKLETVGGNERKTTGSYYTPDSLVASLLDTALDPVLEEAARKPDAANAILALKVCDPAVGSGHFLIRAAHRIARRLAAVRTGDEEPAPTPYREALRDVIGSCLYGVDVIPMSAELCRFNLLLEGLAPGKPLSFLDGHIKVGNSLLGTTPALIRAGIPDDAFKPIEGDSKTVTSAYKKRNKAEREAWLSGQTVLDFNVYDDEGEKVRRGYELYEAAPDGTAPELREKQARYDALEDSGAMAHQRLVADAWCAAFVWLKTKEAAVSGSPPPITTETLLHLIYTATAAEHRMVAEINRLSKQYRFFHWELEFPQVFDGGEHEGFDLMAGNAPWERIKLQEQEWFAARSPDIAKAPNAVVRKRLVKALAEGDPFLYAAFLEDLRKAEGESHLIRSCGRFPLCGRGDINTYSIFAELKRDMVSSTGRVGAIVPSGIATDNTTKDFFADLVTTSTLASLYDFENREKLFVDVDSRMKFSLLTLTGSLRPARAAEFAFFCHAVSDLLDPERRFPLTAEEISLLNPNTRTCPIFRTRRDAEITKSLYQNSIVLKDEVHGGGWEIDFLKKMVDFTIHRELLCELQEDGTVKMIEGGKTFPSTEARPVYEAKLLHHFDHRYASFTRMTKSGLDAELVSTEQKQDADLTVTSRYWIRFADFHKRVRDRPLNYHGFLSVRGITNATNERTTITCIRPFSPAFNSVGNAFARTAQEALFLCACLNSFAADYASRQKLGGSNMDPFVFFQLAVIAPEVAMMSCPWENSCSVLSFVLRRALELTYTAHDLAPFARDLGYEGEPFPWDPERRFLLRCELDAAYFHLYGIAREDVEYIMGTFPIVRRKDEAAHGEYRTSRVILEIYDAMARAARSGQPSYRTPLDPPPVDLAPAEAAPATVTPLRPRPQPERQEETRPAALAAEERPRYETEQKKQAPDPDRRQAEALVDAILDGEDFSELPPEHRGDVAEQRPAPTDHQQSRLSNGNEDATPARPVTPESPNPYDAALALHACLPNGQKVLKHELLVDAARELGYPKLTRQAKTALNKALNVEHNAGRLKTDWALVWKPKKR